MEENAQQNEEQGPEQEGSALQGFAHFLAFVIVLGALLAIGHACSKAYLQSQEQRQLDARNYEIVTDGQDWSFQYPGGPQSTIVAKSREEICEAVQGIVARRHQEKELEARAWKPAPKCP